MCGIFGITDFRKNPIFSNMYWGLRAQNHRGHQSYGFLTCDSKNFHIHKGLDLIPKVKSSAIQEWVNRLPGHIGIGHVRYATSGLIDEKSLVKAIQPTVASIDGYKVAISFNGNIVNIPQLKKEISKKVPDFSFVCDADLICSKLVLELKQNNDLILAVKKCMQNIEGAYSLIGVTKNGDLFAFKDPYGIRPLCCGHKDLIFAFSSETVGLDINGFKRDFEIEPGELITVSKDGFKRTKIIDNKRKAFCAFEFAYFARPDSRFNNKYVYEIREEFGRNLVKENLKFVYDSELIISVPETGDDSALGIHEESGLRWERASRRHRYITERAFILLNQNRYSTIDKKVNFLAPKVNGKKIIVTEDSIVRGDTTKNVIEKLSKMGAKKIRVFVTFPRIIGPCFYGIDMATYSQLIGSTNNAEEIAKLIGANATCYQSIEGLEKATGLTRSQMCLACVTGEYPTPLAQKIADKMKKKFLQGYKETGRLYETFQTDEQGSPI